MLLRALAYDPRERWDLEELLSMVQEVLEHWNFGDESDLFLEGVRGGYDGWEGKYPEPSQRRSGDPEMQVEKLVKRRFPKLPALKNPLGWSFEEDEYDYDDVQLLFPTRKAVRMGYREMPFELGEAEMQSLFLDGRVVGKSGKPVRDRDEIADSAEEPERDEEEEEEREQREADKDKTSKEEDRTSSSNKTTIIISSSRTTSAPSKGKATPKPLRGVKRMRSASEERKRPSPRFSPNSSQVARFGRISQRFLPRSQSAPQSQSEAQSSPHTLSSSQAPRKKQRRHSPTSPNMEQEPREYIRSAGGELYSLPMRSTPGDDGDDQDSVEERSAPWVGYDDDDDESTV
ncbi:hypothetical protein OCU04_009338 [Sclerotinia nivalis]|uniref:Uncharacterized protein n=1 Tax=Sclerotinia nivalis TaxID=352851 RepID=A0A9X0AFR1_9HELO|nr:hypothetical protein OCU04_009338 [Sclerotinia nivalis]